MWANAHPRGNLRHGKETRLARDLEVGWERDGHTFSFLTRAGQHVLAPSLCRLDLVEREYVDAGDVALGSREIRQERFYETLRVVAPRLQHPEEPIGMSLQE